MSDSVSTKKQAFEFWKNLEAKSLTRDQGRKFLANPSSPVVLLKKNSTILKSSDLPKKIQDDINNFPHSAKPERKSVRTLFFSDHYATANASLENTNALTKAPSMQIEDYEIKLQILKEAERRQLEEKQKIQEEIKKLKEEEEQERIQLKLARKRRLEEIRRLQEEEEVENARILAKREELKRLKQQEEEEKQKLLEMQKDRPFPAKDFSKQEAIIPMKEKLEEEINEVNTLKEGGRSRSDSTWKHAQPTQEPDKKENITFVPGRSMTLPGPSRPRLDFGHPLLIMPCNPLKVTVGPIFKEDKIKYELEEGVDTPYYEREFLNIPHKIYGGWEKESEPVLIILEIPKKNYSTAKVLIRNKSEDIFLKMNCKTHRDIIPSLKQKYPHLEGVKFTGLKNIGEKMMKYEQKLQSRQHKFGVLYVKSGQRSEDEMFSNTIPSPVFEEFLSLLGSKIKLKGWNGFAGGLDVKNEATGEFSIYTKFNEIEIMFHVSILLPFQPNDKQRIERKRHIGNDVTVIVFVDSQEAFDPRSLISEFNHVYLIVSPLQNSESPMYIKGKTQFRLGYATKMGVRPFGPDLKDPPIYEGDELRKFLLYKLINSERAAMLAPAFANKLQKTREVLLGEMLSNK